MILPIYTYGQGVLRRPTEEIDAEYPELQQLIADMWDTLARAEGVGLAAPQVGRSIRLFIVDGTELAADFPECADFKKVFINPRIEQHSDEVITYEEGCLSLPGISEKVSRPKSITISYDDENFNRHTETYSGFDARIIQHEYDHLQAHLFTDRISPLRRQLVSGKLNKLAKGKFSCRYKIKG
ncbi:MAG: peptide deformylase [Paludibacteraceae bacterium]|nr:peptide deformylase [Paludibacteraceae bacterium]